MASAMEELERILNAQDHFSVFALPAAETDTKVVRGVYRRLAVQIHPDKLDDPRAKQAFVVLSTAFETLGDADRQFNYLSTLNRASAGGAQGKKHKNRSAAEFQADSQRRKKTAAAPGPKWWENKSWPDIEAEIRRMEEEFLREQKASQKDREDSQARRREKAQAKQERVRQGLAPLMAKYGLAEEYNLDSEATGAGAAASAGAPSAGSSSLPPTAGAGSGAAAAAAFDPYGPVHQRVFVPDLARHRVDSLKPPAALASPLGAGLAPAGVGVGAGSSAAAAPAAAADANCYLCGRKFASTTQLLRHEELSELHRANVATLRAKTEAERAAAAKQRQMEEDLATLLGDAGDASGALGSALSSAAAAAAGSSGSAAAADGGGERNPRKRHREPEPWLRDRGGGGGGGGPDADGRWEQHGPLDSDSDGERAAKRRRVGDNGRDDHDRDDGRLDSSGAGAGAGIGFAYRYDDHEVQSASAGGDAFGGLSES